MGRLQRDLLRHQWGDWWHQRKQDLLRGDWRNQRTVRRYRRRRLGRHQWPLWRLDFLDGLFRWDERGKHDYGGLSGTRPTRALPCDSTDFVLTLIVAVVIAVVVAK